MTGPFIRCTRAVATWQAAHPGIYTPECIADLVSEMQREMAEFGEEERREWAQFATRVIYLCDAIDRALEAARRPKTGMQVPFHGDFASASPSVLGRLEWWARDLRGAMPKDALAAECGKETE